MKKFISTIWKTITVILSFIFNVKILTWLVLVSVIYFSLFKIYKADLTNNVLGIVLMLLLLTLFSDLKEFNFWGLWGKKNEKDFEELKGKEAISTDSAPKVSKQTRTEPAPILNLMDPSRGNFLAIAIDLERLLRILAMVTLNQKAPIIPIPEIIVSELRKANVLTDSGVQQVEAIRWLKQVLIEGRESEINQATLDGGFRIAANLYQEIYNYLYPNQQSGTTS
ncbi:hypothetical protein A2960_05190 [Candidatus Gottesmanbacteria bacterium RIFCSPLOWO2_01_FULL_39_12b]|uniref:Uncharacterized protein n=1 Tax=Candidatus Gottesmanbacteria bacterium RIFCSPLOWO2_01_FULL_39_12b TaxID=1798388 RepID=A0A1F6ALY1_9BACT|nr:MAG: hypothetical protein A2960_05190 [Candidatus Gottesmanbacteria bacterium RIFCSPLOWO2_01_FULL_39_12b]